ncbi:MAG: hypothetical protein R3F59_15145 [Myxococcota bacterium]
MVEGLGALLWWHLFDPHDTVADADGALWLVARATDVLARLDSGVRDTCRHIYGRQALGLRGVEDALRSSPPASWSPTSTSCTATAAR